MLKSKVVSSVLAFGLVAGTLLTGCGAKTEPAANDANKDAKKSEAGGDQKPAKVVEIQLGHTLAPDSHYQATATKFAEIAEKKSNGTVKVSVFPQSQLGGEVKMIQGARTGSVGALITAQAPLENTIKEYAIFDLPYLFDSTEQGNKVLEGPIGKKYLDMLQQHGMVGLGFLSVMERNAFGSKPINKADDMKGFKIRVMQSPGYVKAYEALGAQPTPMAYSEVYLSLQQGVVDGGDTPPDQFILDKFSEVSKYYNITKVHYLPALLAISKVKWDEMNKDQQKVVQEAATEALAFGKENYNKAYAEGLKKAEAAGVKIVNPDIESMKKATQPVYESLLNEIPNGKALFDEIQAAKK